MICVIVWCLVVPGTLGTCEPQSLEATYLDEPRTRRECREVFEAMKMVLPATIKLVQSDWFRPQPQTAQGARKP